MRAPNRLRALTALLALLALVVLPEVTTASWMVPPAPYRPKDFAFIKRDGLYHLFYIRNNPTMGFGMTQVDLGHATSKDLYFWQHLPPVMPVRPGHFDRSHVWAPSIVMVDSVYYLFYTGVSDTVFTADSLVITEDSTGVADTTVVQDTIGTHVLYQRLGVATSVDLDQWNPLEEPIFDFTRAPWATGDSTNSAPFRDPFVMADPTTPGRWLMAYTSAPATDPDGQIVGLASSTDLTEWQDLAPLWITHRSLTFNQWTESPHFFEHHGLWYLFYTTNAGQPISFATTPDIFAPPAAWTYRGRLGTMVSANSAGWFASEYLKDGLVEYFAFVNGDRVEVDKMVWQEDWRFTFGPPDLLHVQRLSWAADTVRTDSSATLSIEAVWWLGRSVPIECFWQDDANAWHSIPNADLGFPNEIPLTAATTEWTWSARSLPFYLSGPPAPHIQVRLVDQTAPPAIIQVMPSPPIIGPPEPPEDPPPPTGDQYPSADPSVDDGANPKLRTLRHSMFGARPALLVDLPQASPARLDIFDLQGRRLQTLADRTLPKGASVLVWDGRDARGGRASAGVYFARLTTPTLTRTTRLFLR